MAPKYDYPMRSVLPAGSRLKISAAIMFLAILGFGANTAAMMVAVPLIAFVVWRVSSRQS